MRPKSIPELTPAQIERFWSKVEVHHPAGCWEWTGAHLPLGYGLTQVRPRCCLAHRVSYSLLIGDIPDGLVLDHLCRNPRCVNPDHLEPVTQEENMRRSKRRLNMSGGRCKRGHLMTPENTKMKGTARRCRICFNVEKRNWKRRRTAKARAMVTS